ncbi:hypothetical protein [Spirosoma validum]|uniref:Uncharacterized protein n=1 Tax=Spirosoma validum TaxID=2771355 RepID=A0A927B8V1_9BACT|nr:hypothetical protein [Spirosoma validum]MBD2757865.1 hypothetical protein [Spirosoma validum]
MKKYILFYAISLYFLSIRIAFSQTADTNRVNFFSSVISTNIKPQLFNDISFGGFDLLAANLQFSKDNSLQKVVFSPFKLFNDPSIFKDSRINFSQKNGISTFGIAYGFDNTNPYNKGKRVANVFMRLPPFPALTPRGAGESEDDFKKRQKKYLDDLALARIGFMQELAKNMISFTIGYNISLFELIGGTPVPIVSTGADNGLISNQFSTKSHNYSLDVNYGVNENFAINVGGVYKRQRLSAVEGQELADYYGFNTSITGRVIWLTPKDKLINNADYRSSLFIPSILIGLSLETLNATGNPKFYEDSISYQQIITPFIDFKISPKSQFRLSVPIKKYTKVDTDFVSTGPFLQYTIELANRN